MPLNRTQALFLALAGLMGFVGVGSGAVGAHVFPLVGENLLRWEKGVLYLLLHALAVLAMGLAGLRSDQPPVPKIASIVPLLVASLWSIGSTVFATALWARALSDIGDTVQSTASSWASFAPAGGMCMLAGWLMLAVFAVWQLAKSRT